MATKENQRKIELIQGMIKAEVEGQQGDKANMSYSDKQTKAIVGRSKSRVEKLKKQLKELKSRPNV